MADPFSDQDQSPGGASKRPAQTIEGTATELSVEPEPNAEARAEPEPPSGRSEDRPYLAGGTAEGGEAEGPPPQTSLPELRSFVTHLAAGLLGGLVGVLALALAWGGLDIGKESAPSPDIAAIEQRLAKLEAAPPSSGNAEAVSELGSRIKALEESAQATSPELSALTARVAQLETALKVLAETASEGGSVPSAAAMGQQIAEAEQRLDAKIAAALAEGEAANASVIAQMQSEIVQLKAKIGALAEAELGTGELTDLGPELAAFNERIAKLEASLPELAGAIDKEAAGAKSAAVAIAFANLRSSVSDGRPYAAELDTIGALAPALGDLGVLPAYAEKGIPTVPELARSFAAAKDGALAATAPASGGSLVDSLLASAQSLVKIKRIDEPANGEGPGAALARAESELGKGDLASAVKEVETLAGAPRGAFSAWLGQAHARLSADATLTRLEGLLLVSMGGDDETPQP
ncbi:MAG: hypothetical protein H7X74_02425 [Methyloceanibacter sp.]|nr:hypothetical protein [Methyloceanibacter sp.]